MKRLRSSYSDDLDDGDWDRPHRRFFHSHKPDEPRDRDRDRDLRPPRKRLDPSSFDPSPVDFDRRRFPPDHRDRLPSPRPSSPYLRRDFPRGFRSERGGDRSRSREVVGWRRSSTSLKDLADADRPSRERSSSRDPPRKLETASDVEEGELEPDPEPEAPVSAKKQPTAEEESAAKAVSEEDAQATAAPEVASFAQGDDLVPDSNKEAEDQAQKVELEEKVGGGGTGGEAGQQPVEEAVGERVGIVEEKWVGLASRVRKSGVADKGKIENEEEARGGGSEPAAVAKVPALDVQIEGENPVVADGSGTVERNVEDGAAEVAGEGPMQVTAELGVGSNGVDRGVGMDCAVGAVGLVAEGSERTKETVTLGLLTNERGRDKGKAPVTLLSNEGNSLGGNDAMEGPSSRGFDLVFCSDAMKLDRMSSSGIVIGKSKEERPKLEPLDLSLGLPGISSNPPFQKPNPKPSSPQRTRSFQSFASSFRTNSDDFTTSISFSGSQTFVHNPSCSLQQNSMENFEHSVHSRPIFQGIDQNANGTVWQGQPSNETKQKGETVPLYQRMLLNGSVSHHSTNAAGENPYSKSNGPHHQSIHPRHLQSMQSHGSQEMRSEYGRENKVLTRERSSSSLFRGEQREKEQVVLSGKGLEKILAKIVSEPVQLIGRRIQEMTDQSVLYMKEAISEMLVNKDRQGELLQLQEVLSRRSDLTLEVLSKCHRVLLEMLVAIKTGLHDFLGRANNASSTELAEIFFNMKCRNLACRSNIPVDECDCKVCSQKNGFCSACMCLICSKFDMASNTCSWVGCDVCLHWCHTDCGVHNSYVRNGRSTTGAPGTTEMQFHCIACDHTSEMFGFVKDVFGACAKDWNAETLAKELEYVRRIFSASADIRGKRLRDVAVKLLEKLENKVNFPEVYRSIMDFLAECDSNLGGHPPAPASAPAPAPASAPAPSKEILQKGTEGNGMKSSESNGVVNGGNSLIAIASEPAWQSSTPLDKLSEKPAWHPSFSAEKSLHVEVPAGNIASLDCDHLKSSHLEIAGSAPPSFDYDKLSRRSTESEYRRSLERKPVLDDLDNIVKFKHEEAKMYQSRADEARREAEGLKRIVIAKSEKIDDEYSHRIAKLRIYETEERRRQKVEELQALERAQHEYFSMKMRMEADIKNLLLKMEAVKHNLRT